jgi:hypothetical protein
MCVSNIYHGGKWLGDIAKLTNMMKELIAYET